MLTGRLSLDVGDVEMAGSIWDSLFNFLDYYGSDYGCSFNDDPGEDEWVVFRIGDLEPEPEFGATCSKCNGFFDHAERVDGFKCWACRNGY